MTFDLATWLLFATHYLVMMIICAKLFSNLTTHGKVMGRTRTGFTEVYAQSLSIDCDLDLWPNDMLLVRDTLSCHDDHLCQIIFKSHHAWLSYGPDTNLEYTNTHTLTHTDRVNSICPSAILWRGHKKSLTLATPLPLPTARFFFRCGFIKKNPFQILCIRKFHWS